MVRPVIALIAFTLCLLPLSARSQAPGSPEYFENLFGSMFDGPPAIDCGSLGLRRKLAAENALNTVGMKEARDIETVKGLTGFIYRKTLRECAFDGKSPFDMTVTMTASDKTILVELKDGVIARVIHTFGIRR